MLFIVACSFRARGLFVYCRRLAVHAGRARRCSGFLRELDKACSPGARRVARAGRALGRWLLRTPCRSEVHCARCTASSFHGAGRSYLAPLTH